MQKSIAHLLTRPVGRPPNHARRYYASFSYQAGSWDGKRRVVAKVVRHGHYITFQMAEVAISKPLFADILRLIDGLRPAALPP